MSGVQPTASLPKPPPLTTEQKKLVASTVPLLGEHGTSILSLMYKKLFVADPSLREVFSETRQQRGVQAKALASSVYAYAKHIEDLTPILPVVERIAQKHAAVHIVPSDYLTVGTALLSALTEFLGPDTFKGALYDAWYVAYWNLAHIFIDREAELYAAADWVGWREFVVEKKEQESEEIKSFYFKPKDGRPLAPHRPGQFVSVRMLVPELGFRQNRQYSCSDTSNPYHYRISVRREPGVTPDHPGTMSNLLHDTVNVGDTIELACAYGAFTLDATSSPLVLLSAGVGETPLLAMLNSTLAAHPERQVSWIHGARNGRAHAFKAHIAELSGAHPMQLRTAVFYSRPDESVDVQGADYHFAGRMDLSKLDAKLLWLEDKNAQYYLCGPEAFMGDVFTALKVLGVDGERIHAEVFGEGVLPA